MRLGLAVVVAAALVMAANSSAAVKPKPWQWTTAQAAQHLNVAIDDLGNLVDGELGDPLPATCRGTGKQPSKGRWVSFACTFPYKTRGFDGTTTTRRVWIKVRPTGRGGACLSLAGAAKITAACLAAKGLVNGDYPAPIDVVRVALGERFDQGFPWQYVGNARCLGADGYHECSFTSAVSGAARVLYRPGGATATFTELACTDAFAGRPECALP